MLEKRPQTTATCACVMPMPPMHQPTPTSTRDRPRVVRQGGGAVKGPERAAPPGAPPAPSTRQRSPTQLTSFCPAPSKQLVSRPTARQVVNSNCRRAVTPASCRGAACLMERLSFWERGATAPNLPGLGIEYRQGEGTHTSMKNGFTSTTRPGSEVRATAEAP
jgi:hypothetical protein